LEKLGDGRFGGWYDQALAGRDARLQGQACLLLGKLGATEVHPEARQQLWRVLRQVGQGASVKLQAAEALARLGDDSVLAKLLAYASSGYADDRILAIAGLGELSGEADARAMLFVLSEDVQAEVALAAVRALGRRATAEQLEWARGQWGSGGIEGDAGSRSRVRALAALAVGATGGPGDAQRLGRLLGDESGYVRVAAARAVGECLGGHRGESKGMK
jgi:HEAT repeat protein